jgi:predicted nucleotidyltransferase
MGEKRGIMDIAVRGSVCRGEGKDKMESAVCVIKVTEQSKA